MRFAVNIIESERGWGSKVDGTHYFDSADYGGDADKALAAAKAFVEKYNADLPPRDANGAAPDWYMMATEPRMAEEARRTP